MTRNTCLSILEDHLVKEKKSICKIIILNKVHILFHLIKGEY